MWVSTLSHWAERDDEHNDYPKGLNACLYITKEAMDAIITEIHAAEKPMPLTIQIKAELFLHEIDESYQEHWHRQTFTHIYDGSCKAFVEHMFLDKKRAVELEEQDIYEKEFLSTNDNELSEIDQESEFRTNIIQGTSKNTHVLIFDRVELR